TTISKTTRGNGRIAGIWTPTSEIAKQMMALGYQFITISTDTRLLSTAAKNIVEQVKE
ncbi:MAG: 2,4-dihydroxyhept-2-ene-1,7-dioic acid aldolase, partial [Chloroflexi bacterium]|nr:2,4-dihydroxyhept-2-ene-1,7-dioic acid aldolase [Chloroflexota bacterium]